MTETRHNARTSLESHQPIRHMPEGRDGRGAFDTGSKDLNARLDGWYDLFTDLVQIPSESGSDMEPIRQRVEAFFQPYKEKDLLTIERIHGALVITLPGRNVSGIQQEPVLLCGHLDTVTPATAIRPQLENTENDPVVFSGDDNEQILGADNKAAVAAMMNIAREFLDGEQDYAPTTIILTPDEETKGETIEEVLKVLKKRGQLKAKTGLILDKSDPIGDVVLGGYGYSRFDISADGLENEKVLQLISQLNERIGGHLVGRRKDVPFDGDTIVTSPNVSIYINKVSIPNKSRNTVPEAGNLQGIIRFTDTTEAQQVLASLEARTVRLGGSLKSQQKGNEITFTISFKGLGGHAKRNDLISVFGDIGDLTRFIVGDTHRQAEITTQQEVRLNVAHINTTRRGEKLNLTVQGEARYGNSTEAATTLGLLRGLVESFGGKMNYVEENRSYQLTQQDKAVQSLLRILQANRITSNIIERAAGMSDANNGTIPGELSWVVTSDGGIDAHSNRERYPLRSAMHIQNIIYDWMTQYRLANAA